jgi:hypothetical protein
MMREKKGENPVFVYLHYTKKMNKTNEIIYDTRINKIK